MTVEKGLSRLTVNTIRRESCKLATLEDIQHQIRKMARTKMVLSDRKKPIMAPELEAEIESALMRYEQGPKWREWGMDSVREQGNMVLLYGPPGTGKTAIANYMSKRLGRGFQQLNMKDVGGKAPGHTEREVARVFGEAKAGGLKTIFLDECEAVLWDRGRAGSDSMWMVGVIDELLMQIAAYKGLVIAATNREDIIDPALQDRCFASLQVGMPERPERLRLWEQKMPDRFPLKLTRIQYEQLAEINLNGRSIENAIVKEASRALAANRLPEYQSLLAVARQLSK